VTRLECNEDITLFFNTRKATFHRKRTTEGSWEVKRAWEIKTMKKVSAAG
jgi:hypothetical protein